MDQDVIAYAIIRHRTDEPSVFLEAFFSEEKAHKSALNWSSRYDGDFEVITILVRA